MNDEWALVGNPNNIKNAVSDYFFSMGRGLFGVYQYLVFKFAGYSPLRIQFLRFINITLIALLALFLYQFLRKQVGNSEFAFFSILFWLSIPSIQGIAGYSLVLLANTYPSIVLSLFAFYLYFFVFESKHIPKAFEALIVFIFLFMAMQSTQTNAFFSTIPVSILALAKWEKYGKRIISFLLISIVTLVTSIILYKVGLSVLHAQGGSGYKLGEQSLKTLDDNLLLVILNSINPIFYWSVFDLFPYPYPFNNISQLNISFKMFFSILLMIVWLALISFSVYIEFKNSKAHFQKQVIVKWGVVLINFAINATFFVADSPGIITQHRPHMSLTLVSLVIYTSIYSILLIKENYSSIFENTSYYYITSGIIIFFVFGAQSNISRNIVLNRVKQLEFIRTELSVLKSDRSINNVVVVVGVADEEKCSSEPCNPWFGLIYPGKWTVTKQGAYRYAMSTIGINQNDIEFAFVDKRPDDISNSTIVLDWNIFLLGQK